MTEREKLKAITSISVSRDKIYVRTADIESASEYDLLGNKLSGNLDLKPNEVLFLAWRQKQSPSLTEMELQRQWNLIRQKEDSI